MPHNGLRCCETLLLLVLHPSGALGRPLDITRRDDDLPARATALNVFAALFTILTLVILAVWLIFRFVRQALAGVSATVTGSTSSSASMTSTTVSYGALIGHPERGMLTVFFPTGSMCGGRQPTGLWSTRTEAESLAKCVDRGDDNIYCFLINSSLHVVMMAKTGTDSGHSAWHEQAYSIDSMFLVFVYLF